jgi:tRNA(Ile2)-agmatinylcytidine synthase
LAIPIYIGIDDTDSVKGMCTTYLATELIKEFSDLDLIGNPRLVRLNPNVPWKTRGNGALALHLGKGQGKKKKIGEISGKSIVCFLTGRSTPPSEDHFERASRVLENLAMFDDPKTNPGIVLTSKKPPQSLYWGAVRGVVDLEEHLSKARPEYRRGYKNGRGLIGAISAVAWRPRDRTYELIAYREKKKWGTPREISEDGVIQMDRKVLTTFNNYDYEEKHMAIAPNSPCPILYGIRGDAEEDLPTAADMVKSEKKDRWIIFLTNQGTDNHVQRASISSLKSFTSVRIRGNVLSKPVIIKGGHQIFSLSNGRRTVDCTIYEPAKGFRKTGDSLREGDGLSVIGGVRERPFTINVEKIRIIRLAESRVKLRNPLCNQCGKRMKSIGKGQGYRCPNCGTKAKETDAEFKAEKRNISLGWHEPPVGSRRHLSKPLKRMR